MTLEFSVAPILLGFVLGPMVEENFRRALLLSRGDMSVFVTRPISATFIGLCALLLLGVSYSAWRGRGGRKGVVELPKTPEGAPPAETVSISGK
jgi:TctA family transporter